MDSQLLLHASRDELLEVEEPLLKEAESALEALEQHGSADAAKAYVRTSVRWIEERLSPVLANILGEAARRKWEMWILVVPVEAPVDPWRLVYPGRSILLTYVNKIRSFARLEGMEVEELTLLPKIEEKGFLGDRSSIRLHSAQPLDSVMLVQRISFVLSRLTANFSALDEIEEVFFTSDDELSRLFGITPQELGQWRSEGIPVNRGADVDRVREVARRLSRKLKHERIPQIVRTPGSRLEGRTVLDVLATEGPDRVHEYLDDLYSYQAA